MNEVRLRAALWATVPFNLAGGLLFAFPSSAPARLVGMPGPVPPIDSAMLAFLILLFGGAYLWQARAPRIDRPMLTLLALGKAGFFLIVLGYWLAGQASGRAAAVASGDLVFAALFGWWLMAPASPPARPGAST